jgi:predicted lactoylglutathione lyase
MGLKIFVNVPAHDLEASKAFYVGLGATINPDFTDENAACVVWNDDIFFMILTPEFFATFTSKPIANPHESAQVAVALMLDSREEVDAKAEAAVAHGGSAPRDPEDYGFMYQRSCEDPSGNIIEFGWMDPRAAEVGPEAYMAEQGA